MTWALKVTSENREGTGVAISPILVLTAEHVVRGATAVNVRIESGKTVAFKVRDGDRDDDLDVALLSCCDSRAAIDERAIVVPRALWSGRWPGGGSEVWAESCTSAAETARRMEVSVQRGQRDETRVQFAVERDRQGARHGHSGGPVLELDALETAPRLVGIVRARDESTVDLLDGAGIGWFVPIDVIAERFERVGALLETPVERAAAWGQHWEPRSRGVATSRDVGFFYAGYRRPYERLRAHLEEKSGLLVVTGARARGKSALLARAVVLSCPRYRTLLRDQATVAVDGYQPLGRVADSAVFARAKSTDAVAVEIADQLGLGARESSEVASAVGKAGRAPSIVIDAVDESEDPRGLVGELVVPLAAAGARIAIGGLRRHFGSAVPGDAEWVDLDHGYRDEAAVEQYVDRRLRHRQAYPPPAAAQVAHAVAGRAAGNFLVAELIARMLARAAPIDTTLTGWQEQLPGSVGEAFREYLARFGEQRDRMLALLHPLAHALGDGLTVDPPTIWLQTANALRPDVLDSFAHSDLTDAVRRASDYLITDPSPAGARRLFHEGLGDAIRAQVAHDALVERGDDPDDDDAILAHKQQHAERFLRCLMGLLPDPDAPVEGYDRLDPYLLRHLPTHLAEQGRASELLARPGLLLAADRRSLQRALARSALAFPRAQQPTRVAVLHALAHQLDDESQRSASLCVALNRQGAHALADRIRDADGPLRYELISGPVLPPMLTTVEHAHSDGISALAVVSDDAGTVLVSGGGDGALRSWRLDGTPGPLTVTDAHRDPFRPIGALAVVSDNAGTVLVSGGGDGALRTWRLDGTPGPLTVTDAHSGAILALAAAFDDAGTILVSGGVDGALRSWRLDGTPGPLSVEHAHTGSITALAVASDAAGTLLLSGGAGALRSWRLDGTPGPLTVDDANLGAEALAAVSDDAGTVLVSGGIYGELRSWRMDGTPGPLAVDDAHDHRSIQALAVTSDDAGMVLVSGGIDGALRSWRLDGTPGPLVVDNAHRWVEALAVVPDDAGTILVSGGGLDGELRSWRLKGTPGPLTAEHAHSPEIVALAVASDEAGTLLFSGRLDGALRSWRLDGTPGPLSVEDANVKALAVVSDDAGTVLVSGDGELRSWRMDGTPGPLSVEHAHRGGPKVLAVGSDDAGTVLVSGGAGELRSWRMDGTPGPLTVDDAHGWVADLAVVSDDAGTILVSGGVDGELRSWRMDGTPGPLSVEHAHTGSITALAVASDAAGTLLLSGGAGELRSWRLDGTPGPLTVDDAHRWVADLAVVSDDAGTILVSGGLDGELRSWRMDGTPGPLTVTYAHSARVGALAVVSDDAGTILVSGGFDGVLLCLPLERSGPLK